MNNLFLIQILNTNNHEEIFAVIGNIEKYCPEYDVSYITPDSSLYTSLGKTVMPSIYEEIKAIPISSFDDDNYACVHSGKYLKTMNQSTNNLVGIVRYYTSDGYTYLLISKNVDEILLSSYFKQINQKGFFAVVDDSGDVISASASYIKMFDNQNNAMDALSGFIAPNNKKLRFKQNAHIFTHFYLHLTQGFCMKLRNS